MKIKVKITTKENMEYYGCAKDTIKEIELEEYIACVVASEMGNAPLEALKAQAVASRSYACAQGVLNGKVISDNAAKAQAFRAKRTNYEDANYATKSTEGLILTYNDKPAATYFCHSNGGHCKSSEEVWGGKREYLVSRADLWTTEKQNGHCVGMSQVGAIAAAKEGVGFRDILKFYYPYTTLEKIKLKQDEDDDYNRRVIEEIKVRVELALKDIKGML